MTRTSMNLPWTDRLPTAIVAIAIAVASLPGLVAAQPRPKTVPVDPYADPAPDDPYADPARPPPTQPGRPGQGKLPTKTTLPAKTMLPAEAPPAKPAPPAKRPAKAPRPAKTAPVDPYALPVAPPRRPAPRPPQGLPSPVDPYLAPAGPAAIPARVGIADLTAIQGLLAVQRLDGWLLVDRAGENPIARSLVQPTGSPTRPWFYLLPAKGEPIALVHAAEQRSFDHLAGKKLTYQGYRDLDPQLKVLLKRSRTVAVEYSVKAAVPSVSRVDAGTIERIRAAGVRVRSSETLVQFTKAIWGDAGRTTHYVAAHHLVELRKDALAFVAKAARAGTRITEYDVQQRLVRGITVRGLVGVPPVVAAGVNTADPYYVPTAARTAPIQAGDPLVISLALKVDQPDAIWAAQTWVAVVAPQVPEPLARAFEAVVRARDRALTLITERAAKRRPVTGAEVDDATRGLLRKVGLAQQIRHRTGHSIDNDLQGGGADLDNFEVKDTRILTAGTGFTIGPGIYYPGEFGVRSEISVFLSTNGPEVTTPTQVEIQALLGR